METQDHQENLDLLEDPENVENLVVMDHQEQLAQTVIVVKLVYQEALANQEIQDQRDNKVTVEKLVNQV